jgi:hypothetical protein
MTTAADCPARIGSTMAETMVAADTAQMKRLTDFASDVLQLAAKRPDLELHALIDDLVADLMTLNDEED